MNARAALAAAVALAACGRRPPAGREAAFAACILSTHVRSAAAPRLRAPAAVRRTVLGFRLSDDLSCRAPDAEGYCAAARPKPWTEADLDREAGVLRGLRARGLGAFLERARLNGFDVLLRQTYVTHLGPRGAWERQSFPNSLNASRELLVGDARLETAGEWPLLHLLAHANDFRGARRDGFAPALSDSPEFLRLTGFILDEDGRWTVARMTPAERAVYWNRFAERNRELLAAGELPDRRERARRESAIIRRYDELAGPYRAASFHALADPYEALADWAVLVVQDPRRARALDPQLARWVETNVLGLTVRIKA